MKAISVGTMTSSALSYRPVARYCCIHDCALNLPLWLYDVNVYVLGVSDLTFVLSMLIIVIDISSHCMTCLPRVSLP